MARTYARHYEEEAHVPALPPDVYAILDDHARFSRHMAEPTWRTLWSTMRLTMDEGAGRRQGSHLMMESRVLGVRLHLDEVVTRREPPSLKEWETTGRPRLLVIGHHRMRAEVHPEGAGSRVRVAIEYDLSDKNAWLGRALGAWYAKWCVRQMTGTLSSHFASTQQPASPMTARKVA